MALYDFDATILMDVPTKDAVWLELEDGTDVWIPRSLLEMDPGTKGDTVECTVPQWFAEAKGIV